MTHPAQVALGSLDIHLKDLEGGGLGFVEVGNSVLTNLVEHNLGKRCI